MNNNRLPYPKYFMLMAYLVARRSTCIRRQVGAVAVKDNQVLATGYNGAPAGQPHCLDIGCLREELGIPSGERHELCRAVHAEQNVIIQASRHGVSLQGATIYCTTQPCFICAKMLVNAGVDWVRVAETYDDPMAREVLGERLVWQPCEQAGGIRVHTWTEEDETMETEDLYRCPAI